MEDDDKPAGLTSPLATLLGQDLQSQSIEDLERRIARLNQEIARVEQVIQAKKNLMGTAQSLFKS